MELLPLQPDEGAGVVDSYISQLEEHAVAAASWIRAWLWPWSSQGEGRLLREASDRELEEQFGLDPIDPRQRAAQQSRSAALKRTMPKDMTLTAIWAAVNVLQQDVQELQREIFQEDEE